MTKDEAREAAWWRYVNRCTKVTFSATFYEGFYAGYEAAEAAERERIIAALGAVMKDESLMDAYDEGYNDGLAKAIEIVKGGDER